MNHYPLKIFFFILSGLSILSGCDETYDLPPSVYSGIDLSYSNSLKTTSPVISVYGIGVTGADGKDSLLYDSISTKEISLPFSINDNSAFVLTIDSITDTLTIYHTNTLTEESIESGFYYKYEITSVNFTTNRIDSVAIQDSTVTSVWNENLEIYINDNN